MGSDREYARGWRGYTGPLWILAGLLLGWILLSSLPTVRDLFFLAFFATGVAVALEMPIAVLSRWMPRSLATLAVLLALLSTIVTLAAFTVPILVEQGGRLIRQAPAALHRIQVWWDQVSGNESLRPFTGEGSALVATMRRYLSAILTRVVPLALGLVTLTGNGIVIIAVAMFLAHDPRWYANGFVRLFPPEKEEAVRSVLEAAGTALRDWIRGTLIAMTLIGAFTALGLLAVGIDSWFVLAVLSFFGELVPFLGPILTAIPGLAVGLAESPRTALWVLVVYVAVHQIEGNLVQPFVMRRAVRLRPAMLILWQLAFTLAFGLMGLLISTPLLAVVQSAVVRGYIERTLNRGAGS